MAKKKTVQCRYKYCKHESREMNRDEAVHVGNSYYHEDCFKESRTIDKIIETYTERVDKNPVYTHLRKTINTIVYKNKVDAEFLLFALEYAAQHKMIKHVPGLFYIVKSKDIQKAWDKKKTAEYMRSEKSKPQEYVNNTTREFTFKAPKQKTVASLFK